MKWKSFSTEVPGKWVLSGEHTVLRGGSAIALPHPELKLRLEFRPEVSPRTPAFSVEPDFGMLVIQELLRIAKSWLTPRGVSLELPHGHLKITSTIPFGAGLGSSAALSVATARWVLSACGMDRSLERELAREMENRFHGKSSGMDVSVVSLGEPILFSMKDGAISLGLAHLPKFEFIDTGIRASTKDCIQKVEALRASDAELAEKLDHEMMAATQEVLEGLRAYDEVQSKSHLERIVRGMNHSREVFEKWGLVPDGVINPGFSGWRITGSGGGGYLVGLKA